MLFDLKLSNGFWNTINREARHINIVLAAGEIQARFVSKKGANYQTKMVSGMALELPKFDRVEIKSDVDQQIKVWVSDVPLSYSPDTARQVGSNALQSFNAQVFSDEPTELLPAQIGRNRITLNPSKDIYIGGSNLNLKNGVKLKANEPFTMATQGAVFAYETSGEYPPFYTAEIESADFNSGVSGLGSPHGTDASIYETENSEFAYTFTNGNATARRLNKSDYSYVNNVSLGQDFYFDYVVRDGKYLRWMDGRNTGSTLCEFNLETGEVIKQKVKHAGADLDWVRWHFIRADYIYYFVHGEARFYRAPLSDKYNVVPWGVAVPHNDGAYMSLNGIGVGVDGQLIVSGDLIWRSVDDGATWQNGQTLPIDFGGKVKRFILDKSTDICYMVFDEQKLHKSYNYGSAWELEIDFFQESGGEYGVMQSMDILVGAIAVSTRNGAFFRDPQGAWQHKRVTEIGGGNGNTVINDTGTVHFVTRSQVDYFVKGKRVPANGLPVSIMAEVN